MTAILVSAMLLAAPEEPSPAAEIRSWYQPAAPFKIAGPIHFVGTRGLGVYLITTAEGHILLNGAMPNSANLIVESIRKLGFKPTDIKIMLTCHAHIDHVGTHAHFKDLTSAQVAIMAEEVELLESGGKTDFHYANLPTFHFKPVKVDRALRDGDTVKLGDVILTAHHTPGHTKGGTTWSTTITDGGKAHTVIFPDGTSINPGYRLERHPSYPGIADDLRRTLHKHEMMKPDIALHPHTSFFDFEKRRLRAEKEGVKAWVDPEAFRQFTIGRRNIFEKSIDAELAGPDIVGAWKLAKITDRDGKSTKPEVEITVKFNDDGRATLTRAGTASAGTWKLAGWGEIVLGELKPATVKDWASIRKYELKDGKLTLSLADDAGQYQFEPAK